MSALIADGLEIFDFNFHRKPPDHDLAAASQGGGGVPARKSRCIPLKREYFRAWRQPPPDGTGRGNRQAVDSSWPVEAEIRNVLRTSDCCDFDGALAWSGNGLSLLPRRLTWSNLD